MRRVTIATDKLEETVRLHTDVFGAKIFYDRMITPESNYVSPFGPAYNVPHRQVLLQQGDCDIGTFGLIGFRDPTISVQSFEKKPSMPHPMVFVIRVDNVNQVANKVRNLGLTIIRGPDYMAAQGKGAPGHTLVIVDPNGVVLELSQPPKWDPLYLKPTSPILRATIAVARDKMEPSIKFYKQVLGMSPMLDKEITFDPGTFPLGDTGRVVVRLAVMQQDDNQVGNVGLMTYLEPEMEIQPFIKQPGSPYQLLLVFHVDDMEYVLSRAKSLGSVLIARKAYADPQRGKVDGASIIDTNGIAYDLIQFL